MDDRLAAAQRALGPPSVAVGSAVLWQGDALELLGRLPDDSVQLVVTSPPYNIGKQYEPRRTVDEYVAWCSRWLGEISRVLTPTGAAWVNVGYTSVPGRGVAVPIPYLLWPHFGGLQLVQEVVWHQTNGVACRRRLSPRNEKLLWLVRDPSAYAFNLDAIRDPNVAYPYQRRRGRLRCNPLGKNPGDVWTIPRVVAGRNAAERTRHPAQMPLALAERLIKACSEPGDLVLDPLAGSGAAWSRHEAWAGSAGGSSFVRTTASLSATVSARADESRASLCSAQRRQSRPRNAVGICPDDVHTRTSAAFARHVRVASRVR